MKDFWWKLPLLRRLTPLGRGLVEAFGVTFGVSALASGGVVDLFPDSAQAAGAFAQIGATLLVAYAVQMSWVLQHSRKRGPDRENWVGITTGIGTCALIGIAVALAMESHHEGYNLPERFGFAWIVISIGFLGLWIAIQPWAMYEWTHKLNIDHSDE